MEVKEFEDIEIYSNVTKMVNIGNVATKSVREQNISNNIPNVSSFNGKLFFQLPDGEITSDNPFDN